MKKLISILAMLSAINVYSQDKIAFEPPVLALPGEVIEMADSAWLVSPQRMRMLDDLHVHFLKGGGNAEVDAVMMAYERFIEADSLAYLELLGQVHTIDTKLDDYIQSSKTLVEGTIQTVDDLDEQTNAAMVRYEEKLDEVIEKLEKRGGFLQRKVPYLLGGAIVALLVVR